jgi:hypothetical protein
MPKPMTKRVMERRAISNEVSNSSATPSMPGVTTADANATAKQTKLTVMVMVHFRHCGQFCGFAGSPSENSTSL